MTSPLRYGNERPPGWSVADYRGPMLRGNGIVSVLPASDAESTLKRTVAQPSSDRDGLLMESRPAARLRDAACRSDPLAGEPEHGGEPVEVLVIEAGPRSLAPRPRRRRGRPERAHDERPPSPLAASSRTAKIAASVTERPIDARLKPASAEATVSTRCRSGVS